MSLEEFMIYYTDCYKVMDGKRVFDEKKMKRTYEEYVYDSEFRDLYIDNKIYYNKMYYDKHIEYKNINL